MPKKRREVQRSELQLPELPLGVKLLRTLEGHKNEVLRLAFDSLGQTLASGSSDHTVNLWDVSSGKLLRTLEAPGLNIYGVAFDPEGQTLATGGSDKKVTLWDVASGTLLRTFQGQGGVNCIAFDPAGRWLASSSSNTVKVWDLKSGKLLRTLEADADYLWSVAFDPTGQTLATAGDEQTVKLWEVASGTRLRTLEGHANQVLSIAFDSVGQTLASGSSDNSVKVWDVGSGRLLRTLEGHTSFVETVAFSLDGQMLASKGLGETLRLWSCKTWETVAVITDPLPHDRWIPSLAFHPTLPLLASVGSKLKARKHERSRLIHLWEFDLDVLLSKGLVAGRPTRGVHHTTAKIVLVGDSGVGKTGLGWRLAHGDFKEHSSTHGQQFWVVSALGTRRKDGTECEAILWDLAGQPDYRLTHALFLDDADLALVLFDPTDSRDPLHGVEFWLKQLKAGKTSRPAGQRTNPEEKNDVCPVILVGSRSDRGEARLTQDELDAFCQRRGIIGGYLATSAKEDIGLDTLLARMRARIPWDQKPATVTTATFKRIKDYVLGLKENRRRKKVIVSSQDLRKRLQKTDKQWTFADAEMMTAVKHLANYGYVRVLRTSKSEERILLAPELLNNLAASFVLEARRNPKGLGSLEEKRLLEGGYAFREMEKLSADEQDVLLDSAALLFLEHNICFRETDPLGGKSYLVFPELINLKKPLLEDDQATEDGVAYTVSGAVENVYASLVVLLAYTPMFTRTNQWRNEARYEVGDGLICGFRQDADRDGELDLVLYFGTNVGQPVKTLFQGLFESFLARRNLSVLRYEPIVCGKCRQPLARAVARERLRGGKDFAFCPECSERLKLPQADEPIQMTQTEQGQVEEQRRIAGARSRFEQAVFQVMSYVKDQKLASPECFISYAWGEKDHERWVERNFAPDLQKAGINVVLDRWENARAGKSVSRFVARIARCDAVIPIGTPLYFQKFENGVSSTGSVVASEVDLINQRLMSTEARKETVMPVLLAGDKESSLPPLMWDRVFIDFRDLRTYFTTAFDLILDLYGVSHNDPAVADLRYSLPEWDRPTATAFGP